jgi:hypothetical protein
MSCSEQSASCNKHDHYADADSFHAIQLPSHAAPRRAHALRQHPAEEAARQRPRRHFLTQGYEAYLQRLPISIASIQLVQLSNYAATRDAPSLPHALRRRDYA